MSVVASRSTSVTCGSRSPRSAAKGWCECSDALAGMVALARGRRGGAGGRRARRDGGRETVGAGGGRGAEREAGRRTRRRTRCRAETRQRVTVERRAGNGSGRPRERDDTRRGSSAAVTPRGGGLLWGLRIEEEVGDCRRASGLVSLFVSDRQQQGGEAVCSSVSVPAAKIQAPRRSSSSSELSATCGAPSPARSWREILNVRRRAFVREGEHR